MNSWLSGLLKGRKQFTVDPRWRAPRVLAAHPPDQGSNLAINPWTAADAAGLLAPVGGGNRVGANGSPSPNNAPSPTIVKLG